MLRTGGSSTARKKKRDSSLSLIAYRQFVQSMRNQYRKANIICVLGNMDAVKPGSPWPGYIEKTVVSLNDKTIFTHFFTFINKPDHPNVAEQKQMAKSLIHFIEEHIE